MMEIQPESLDNAKNSDSAGNGRKNTMIDIHSHIIFDVDDGPKNFEDSKKLLEESYRQGVRTIISTSHRRKGMFENA